MNKEKVRSITFDDIPDIKIRVINDCDTNIEKQNKIKYPFELCKTITVSIITSKRHFKFSIFNGYTWNGADIPKFFYRIIGSRTSNRFLIASMLHDYMLEFKAFILNEILKNQISVKEYRRLTSLIFREILKKHGTSVIKSNIMSWCVDVFQMYNKRNWQCL